MDKSDKDDFEEVLSRFGYSSNDFKITETDVTNYDPNRIVPLDEYVNVKRISTKIERSYYSGNISHWVVDFEKDLTDGKFN